MAKKICPLCRKKIKDFEECCPKCGYYFSMNTTQIDGYGRPFSEYQESMHSDHHKPDCEYYTPSNYSPSNETYYKVTKTTVTNSNGETKTTVTTTENDVTKTETFSGTNPIPNDVFFDQFKSVIDKNSSSEFLNDEELISKIKKLFASNNIGSASGVFFGIFWTLFSSIFVLVGLGESEPFFVIFGMIFVIVGITIISSSIKSVKNKNNLMIYVNKKDWVNLNNYIGKFGYEANNTHLLYIGALICFYKLNDKKLAKKYLTKAIETNQSILVFNLKTFAPLITELELTDTLKNLTYVTSENINFKND